MILDNRLYNQCPIAGNLLHRSIWIVAYELVQRPRVQLHGVVEIGGVNRYVLFIKKIYLKKKH